MISVCVTELSESHDVCPVTHASTVGSLQNPRQRLLGFLVNHVTLSPAVILQRDQAESPLRGNAGIYKKSLSVSGIYPASLDDMPNITHCCLIGRLRHLSNIKQ